MTFTDGVVRAYLSVDNDMAGQASGDWMCRNIRVWARDELSGAEAIVVHSADKAVLHLGTIDGGC
jgi:hypothetical protein